MHTLVGVPFQVVLFQSSCRWHTTVLSANLLVCQQLIFEPRSIVLQYIL